MSSYVKIMVVDRNGNGVSRISVKERGGDETHTNSDGIASLILEGSRTTIYVNGFEAYSGSVNNLDKTEIFDTCGRQPWVFAKTKAASYPSFPRRNIMGFWTKCDHDWQYDPKEMPGDFCLFGHNPSWTRHQHRCTRCGTTELCDENGNDHIWSNTDQDKYRCSKCGTTHYLSNRR